jgi:ATP-dependent DNA ligase
MEALPVEQIPTGGCWQYEPKWDGFRCLVFREGVKVDLQSKAGRPLTRYFPELVETFLTLPAQRFVIDGEIVIPQNGVFSFDALLQRIHPAQTRIDLLAAQTPAIMVAFDLLADADGRSLLDLPLRERRRELERFADRYLKRAERIRLSPATTSLTEAKAWLRGAGAMLDGIVAKRLDFGYRCGDRSGMQKIKNNGRAHLAQQIPRPKLPLVRPGAEPCPVALLGPDARRATASPPSAAMRSAGTGPK